MLEPQIAAFIEEVESLTAATPPPRSLDEQREQYDRLCRRLNPPRPAGITTDDALLPGPAGDIPYRLYRCGDNALRMAEGAILFLHGGGFVLGGLDSHDSIAAHICKHTGHPVLAIDYRLAPEHRCPAALDDSLAALTWLRNRLREDTPVALCGDSAGATLCAGLALLNRDKGGKRLAGMVLIYPALGWQLDLPSFTEEAQAPLLRTADLAAYRDAYYGPAFDHGAYGSPLIAPDLSGLPPTLLLPVEHDPLRDEAFAFAERLHQAGVPVSLHLGKGLVHASLRAAGRSPGVDTMVARCTGWLSAQLSTRAAPSGNDQV